jgi:hypothetical protein
MQLFDKIRDDVKLHIERLTEGGFQQIFDHIDQLGIKRGVDRLGLEKFIDQCAWLAAGSGAIAGTGGLFTMIVGLPVDFLNLITQQFRITMAIMYRERGTYEVDFHEFMRLIATSLKVEASVALTKTMLENTAERMLAVFGTRVAERLVPVVGAAIGGTTNYLFIKRMAKSVKQMQFEPVVITVVE